MPVILPTHPPLDAGALDDFESRFAIRLPIEYRRFLINYNGGKPMPKHFDTVDGKIRSMVVRFFPLWDDDIDSLEDEYTDLTLDGELPRNLIPIAIDPIKNRLVLSLDGDDAGFVYYWSWDQEPAVSSGTYRCMRLVAKDFDQFLSSLNGD